jgi:hypothetical protein
MGQFFQVNGDYNIKTSEGADIKLDTGPGVGRTIVTGNLVVEGDTTIISAENLAIKDNIIIVNDGETGAGVTLRYSGIQVDRGTEEDVLLVWDEDDDTWNFKQGAGYNSSRLRVKEILTNADTDAGDLTLIGTGTGVVKVAGTLNYELNVTDDDDIPNKRYVDTAIQTNPTFQIVRDNTRVAAFDSNNPATGLFPIGPYAVQPLESQVAVVVENNIVTEFFSNRVQFGGLTLYTEDPTPFNPLIPDAAVIQTRNTNANIKFETNGTGKVEITYALQMNNLGTTPASVSGGSLLYGNTAGVGTTGLYFVNTTKTDELISKSKALVFSMIF